MYVIPEGLSNRFGPIFKNMYEITVRLSTFIR